MWMFDPHSGGNKIPDRLKPEITKRILKHAEVNYAGKYIRIGVRFKATFCYIDAYTEPFVPEEDYDEVFFGKSREERIEELRNIPTHLCRLRHFAIDRWSMAFYTYSGMKYEPSFFDTSDWFGTIEEGFDTSAIYLTG